jgi:gliding motility-associated-like protein
MNCLRKIVFLLSCCLLSLSNFTFAQTYNDGPILLQAKVREIQVTTPTNDDLTLTVGPLPLANFSTDEYSFKVYARDDQDLDATGYTGGTCLQQDLVTVPNTTVDFNSTIFNFTYLTPTVPQFLDINLDAWEDDIATDFVTVSGLTPCGNTTTFPRCTFNPLFCCVNIPFVGCVNEGDDIRCNPTVFYDNLNYRNGPPCQWTDQGFLTSSNCGVNNFYRPRIETFWRYTRGTSCANAIPLGNVAPGFGSLTHFNSNECYSNNFAASPGNDVFYAINVTSPTGVNVSLCGGATWDTYLYLLNGSCTTIISDDNGCGINSSVLNYGICSPGTYYIVVDGALAASMGTFTVVVTENPSLVPTASAGNAQIICRGQSVVIGGAPSASGGVGPYTYSWSPTTGLNNANIANPIASPIATTTYTLSVTDFRGCLATRTVTVNVNNPPAPNLGANRVICPGTTVNLSAGPGYTNYFWSNGTSGVSNINVGAVGNYAVTVIDPAGCIGADTVSVSNFVPTGLNLGPNTSICAGGNITLTAPPGMPAYNWSTGATGVNTISVNAAGTYSVTITDPNSCNVRDTIIIGVNALPTVALGPDFAVCPGVTSFLDAGSGFVSYIWNTGATTSTISPPSGSYVVTVTDVNGCQNNDAINITAYPAPTVNLGPNRAFCQNTNTSINGPVGMASYAWNTGSVTASISTAFPGTYILTVTDANGCEAADTLVLTWSSAPTVSLGPDLDICGTAGQTVSATAGFSTYLWNTSAATPSITVNASGTYSVIATDAAGCIARDTVVVAVYPLPVVALGNDFTVCPGVTSFLDAGTGFLNYIWNTSATSSTISPAPGAYSVTVTDVNGCQNSDAINILTFPAPSVSLGADRAFCQGSTTNLSATAGMASYAWNTGATSQSISPAFPGTYMVTITDANGCEDADTILLNWNAAPIVSLGPDLSFCGGGAPQTIAATSGFSSYLWNTTATTPSISVNASGTYSVIATDAAGCIAYDTVIVTVLPAVVVNLGADTVAICDSGSVMLDAGPGALNYAWSGSSSANQFLVVNTPGTYSVTATGVGGCTGMDTVVVLTTSAIGANLLPPTGAYCETASLELDPGAGYLSYDWNNGASNAQILNVDTAGSYFVEVIDANGCRFLDTIAITEIQMPPLEVADVIICPGETATLVANSGFSNYLWSTGATTPTINAVPPGNYNVTVTLGSCQLSDEADVSDKCNSSIQIPNVFTPNGDGFNDFFLLQGINVETVSFWIVDRWGRTLFTGNALNAQWDGKTNGHDAPEGVYFLAIKYKYKDEIKEHEDEVPVTLFR